MTNYAIISAVAKNKTIGDKNKLLWYLPSDLRYFKVLTKNNTVVMGRNTFDSIGKILPQRLNVVLTKDNNFKMNDIIIINNIDDIFKLKLHNDVFIIGGSEIYQQTINRPEVTKMYLTEIHHNFDGDAKFPNFNNDWRKINKISHFENNISFDFTIYNKVYKNETY